MLIVEDGSLVLNANSYVTDIEYRDYAVARNYSVPLSSTLRETELLKAMDYLESHRDKFKGIKASREQSLQWPRSDAFIDGYLIGSGTIPNELKRAQMELAYLVSTGVEITPSGTIENVQSESIGDLSVSYFSGGKYQTVQMKSVDQFLSALLINGGRSLRSQRI